MPSFFGVVHKTPTNEFTVRFPDCPDCVAVGSTFTEVEMLAAEALQHHLETLIAAGASLPAASTIDAVKRDPASRGGVVIAVSVIARARPLTAARPRARRAAPPAG
jgi:predicted RNase H-like HicB family nuclease